MTVCQKVRVPHRTLCSGDLDTEIHLKDRQIVAPSFDPLTGEIDANFTESFGSSTDLTVWSAIKTVNGKVMFNGVGTDQVTLTHQIYIYFDPTVTSESWVILDETRMLDIMKVEDLDEKHEFLVLFCVERGVGEAAKA
jgi:SPP1 family predicted phage head-tail adaptor